MKFPTPLPEKISINLLYEYLGLSSMSQDAKLEALKSYSKDSGLLFTFPQPVIGMSIEISRNDIYDETDEFKPASKKYMQAIFKAKNFTLNDYFTVNGKPFTCIRQFEVSGVGYNVINKDKSNFGSYNVDLAKVYVKQSDFINFMNESGDNALSDLPTALQPARATKACISAPRQEVLKLSPLDQRYEFLKEWTQKTLQGVPFDEFIAEYDEELTKEKFYKLLSKEYKTNYPNDSNIFISGLDAFYKDKRVKVKFKLGKRKNS
jgi:hypothetical protein